jgi:integrase
MEFVDWRGVRVRQPGTSDRKQTLQLAVRLEREHAEARALGVPHRSSADRRPLADWAAEFLARIEGRGRTKGHVATVRQQLAHFLDGISDLHEFTQDHAERRLADIASRRPAGTTARAYHTTAMSFGLFLAKRRAVAGNPLIGLERPPLGPPGRRRRSESPDFLGKLISATRTARRRGGLGGESRAWLYTVAALTGYRARELAAMLPADFDLDQSPPVARLPAEFSKRGEAESQPIPDAIVPALRAFLASRTKAGPVWRGGWYDTKRRRCSAARMLRADLADAGLPFADARGRAFDFHALRVTYITSLGRSGVPFAVVFKLARHATPALTLKVYSDHGIIDQAAGVNQIALPTSLPDSCQPLAPGRRPGSKKVAESPPRQVGDSGSESQPVDPQPDAGRDNATGPPSS